MNVVCIYVCIYHILRDFFTHKVHVVTVCTCMKINNLYFYLILFFSFLFFSSSSSSLFSFLFPNTHFLDLCSYIALLYYTEWESMYCIVQYGYIVMIYVCMYCTYPELSYVHTYIHGSGTSSSSIFQVPANPLKTSGFSTSMRLAPAFRLWLTRKG